MSTVKRSGSHFNYLKRSWIALFRYVNIQLQTIDFSTRLWGINYRVCGVYSPEPRDDVYCFKLNFKISKLAYSVWVEINDSLVKILRDWEPYSDQKCKTYFHPDLLLLLLNCQWFLSKYTSRTKFIDARPSSLFVIGKDFNHPLKGSWIIKAPCPSQPNSQFPTQMLPQIPFPVPKYYFITHGKQHFTVASPKHVQMIFCL